MKFASIAHHLRDAGSSSRADPQLTATGVDLAVVTRGLDAVPSWPVAIATKIGIVFEGMAIATIDQGYLDPADEEGGSTGVKIERLSKITEKTIAAMKEPPPGIVVVLDQTTPYRTVLEMVYSMKVAGMKRFGFVTKAGSKLGIVSLTLADQRMREPRRRTGHWPSRYGKPIRHIVWQLGLQTVQRWAHDAQVRLGQNRAARRPAVVKT